MSDISMYRLIVDSRESGTFRRACVMRRQLARHEARTLNNAFKGLDLTDRYVKERKS